MENLVNAGGAWLAFGGGVAAEVCGERIFKTEFFENLLCGGDRLVCEHSCASCLGDVPFVFRRASHSIAVPIAIAGSDSLHELYNAFVRFRIFYAMLPIEIGINFMDFLDFLFAVVFAGERFGDFFHVASTCDGNEICSDCSADQVHGTVPDECAHVIIAMRVQTELRHRVVYGWSQIAKRIE